MARPFDVVTFDCYGTLVDWESGISAAFAEAARASGGRAPPEEAVRLHAEIEPSVQALAWRPYREVLAETARRMAARLGFDLAPGAADRFGASPPSWPPFADTAPVLERMARHGYRLGILSNVDDDLLAATLFRFPVRFELVVTAERVRSYKPSRGHFDEARRTIGDARWLHAAQSLFHDVAPARALGIPAAWVNRKREPSPGDEAPEIVVGSIAELADRLGAP
jgi:2-haloalkanoic acid dehalogenase type II